MRAQQQLCNMSKIHMCNILNQLFEKLCEIKIIDNYIFRKKRFPKIDINFSLNSTIQETEVKPFLTKVDSRVSSIPWLSS